MGTEFDSLWAEGFSSGDVDQLEGVMRLRTSVVQVRILSSPPNWACDVIEAMRVLEARPERGVGASPIMPTKFLMAM